MSTCCCSSKCSPTPSQPLAGFAATRGSPSDLRKPDNAPGPSKCGFLALTARWRPRVSTLKNHPQTPSPSRLASCLFPVSFPNYFLTREGVGSRNACQFAARPLSGWGSPKCCHLPGAPAPFWAQLYQEFVVDSQLFQLLSGFHGKPEEP